MKINEPKTPYARRYDPAEDEDDNDENGEAAKRKGDATTGMGDDSADIRTLDAGELVVDELDKVVTSSGSGSRSRTREDEIPGLELGEPEEAVPEQTATNNKNQRMRPASGRSSSGSGRHEKQVIVDDPDVDHGSGLQDGGVDIATDEEREKHRKFEEMRKRHYEMRNVKGLLGLVYFYFFILFFSCDSYALSG